VNTPSGQRGSTPGQGRGSIRIIDAHTHPFGNRGLDLSADIRTLRDPILLRRRNPDLWRLMNQGTDDLTDGLIQEMDAFGIDKAVIQSRGMGRNEDVALAVRKHPDRLVGLFRPVYNTRLTGQQEPIDYQELERQVGYWVTGLGLKGMGEIRVSRFSSESAPEKIARDLGPLMEILAPHRAPIMFQTAWTQFGTPIYHGIPLFVDNLAESFPEVPIIITKMGRGYDFLFDLCLMIAYKHDNVYLDSVQSKPEHISKAVSAIGAERIMFGTDWEQSWSAVKEPADLYTRSLAVVEDARLSEVQREWVLGKTAATLYGI
jgi:predicted TIM-barrel fold metal-dependent hydrolase